MNLSKYLKTARMVWGGTVNGGVAYLLPCFLLRVVYLLPLLLLWRSLMAGGVDVGMTLEQMLAYTYLGAVFSEILVVRTPASHWLYEGLIVSLYQRPMGVLAHLAAQTVGGWLPALTLFSLPMLLLAPVLGVSLAFHSLWFVPSLLLCISLGFAADFLFACLTIRMKNASWLVYSIRMAIVSLLSGSVIPFAVLPWGLGKVFQFLPLGSLAGAPLSIYTGLAEPGGMIALQLLWNVLLWPAAVVTFQKSGERMVSHGG